MCNGNFDMFLKDTTNYIKKYLTLSICMNSYFD